MSLDDHLIECATMKFSLRSYIFLFVIFPLVVLGIASSQLILSGLEKNLEKRMQDEVELVAKAVKPLISHAVNRFDENALNLAMKSVSDINRIYSLYVYNQSGQLIASLGPDLPQRKQRELKGLLDAGKEVGEYDQLVRREVYSYFVPLKGKGVNQSSLLHVTRRKSDFSEDLFQLRATFYIVTFFIGATILLLLQITYNKGISSPLNRMRRVIDKIREGENKARLSAQPVKEFDLMSADINQMLDDLDQSRDLLVGGQKEQLELIERLQQSEKMAALGQFAAGIAHELGTPLSVSNALIQRKRRSLPIEHHEFLNQLEDEQNRMQEIIRKVLNFSHPEVVAFQELKLDEFMSDIEKRIKEYLSDDFPVEININRPKEKVFLTTNKTVLEQVLYNLVKNSLDAIKNTTRPKLEINTDINNEEIILSVSDNGPGIPEESHHKVFEPFYSTKSVGSGTGLGLSIVHTLVKEIEADISVQRSQQLGGAEFLIKLKRGWR